MMVAASVRAGETAGHYLSPYQRYSSKEEPPEDEYDFDARILTMLSQKGDPMLQSELAANLGMQEELLAWWLASMERREMIRRTWDRTRSTYVIHLVAGPS